MWGLNSRSQDQQEHALPNEPPRHPKETQKTISSCKEISFLALQTKYMPVFKYILLYLYEWDCFINIFVIFPYRAHSFQYIQYFPIWMHQNLFSLTSTERYAGCFHFLQLQSMSQSASKYLYLHTHTYTHINGCTVSE